MKTVVRGGSKKRDPKPCEIRDGTVRSVAAGMQRNHFSVRYPVLRKAKGAIKGRNKKKRRFRRTIVHGQDRISLRVTGITTA